MGQVPPGGGEGGGRLLLLFEEAFRPHVGEHLASPGVTEPPPSASRQLSRGSQSDCVPTLKVLLLRLDHLLFSCFLPRLVFSHPSGNGNLTGTCERVALQGAVLSQRRSLPVNKCDAAQTQSPAARVLVTRCVQDENQSHTRLSGWCW